MNRSHHLISLCTFWGVGGLEIFRIRLWGRSNPSGSTTNIRRVSIRFRNSTSPFLAKKSSIRSLQAFHSVWSSETLTRFITRSKISLNTQTYCRLQYRSKLRSKGGTELPEATRISFRSASHSCRASLSVRRRAQPMRWMARSARSRAGVVPTPWAVCKTVQSARVEGRSEQGSAAWSRSDALASVDVRIPSWGTFVKATRILSETVRLLDSQLACRALSSVSHRGLRRLFSDLSIHTSKSKSNPNQTDRYVVDQQTKTTQWHGSVCGVRQDLK